MSPSVWDEVALRVAESDSTAGPQRSAARIEETAEVFTPTELVVKMLMRIDPIDYGPGKTVLDPACGDGQFLVAAKWAKVLVHGMSEEAALDEIYGIDIMRDNIDVCRRRLGGGTVVMGDALNPESELPGQTESERATMRMLFGLDAESDQLSLAVGT